MKTVVAFLGTGLMGAPMALRLIEAGFDVRVWNRSPAKALPLVEAGATLAPTPLEAVADAAWVCLCLTDGEAAIEVLFGNEGAAGNLMADAVIVDFSTIGPDATADLARAVAKLNGSVRWIDAPVSGGVKGATAGELVVFCGGSDDDVTAAAPLFEPLSKRVCHMGPRGSGQAAKLCNQLIVAVNVVAMAEALALAAQHGLELGRLPDALAGGWADSLPLQIIGSRMAAGVTEPPIVALGTFSKDLDLVLGSSAGDLPVAARASAVYRRVLAEDGDRDASGLLGCIEQFSGRADPPDVNRRK